jgi:hypothetical protein
MGEVSIQIVTAGFCISMSKNALGQLHRMVPTVSCRLSVGLLNVHTDS